jgi:hypothetical protein
MSNYNSEDISFDNRINLSLDDGLIEQEIKSNGVSLRLGNKVIRFNYLEEELITLKDEVVNDYHSLYNKKINELNAELEKQSTEYKFMYDKKMQEIVNLKHELSNTLKSSNLMPEVTYDHFLRGLTICKNHDGYNHPNIVWFYRGNYHVKYLNRERIDPAYSIKKLNKPVMIEIVTSGYTILSVKVLNMDGSKFVHYHSFSHGSDCWGSWQYNELEAKSPDDIILIAEKSLDLLSVINELSIANRTPRGLPRLHTIRKNMLNEQPTNTETPVEEPVQERRRRTVWDTNRY